MKHPAFSKKRILLIDASDKTANDRTWCFWETKPGIFQEIVCKEWPQIDFFSKSLSLRSDLSPYRYKMIRGGDLYQYVLTEASAAPNVSFLQEKVVKITYDSTKAQVITANATYTAAYVFNSIIFNPAKWRTKGSLLQHFMGWTIETTSPAFNKNVAILMDFRMQPSAENTFVYVLPVTEQRALVEYTVFSPAVLPKEKYKEGLENYIAKYLNLQHYAIAEEEFGVIPMSTLKITTDYVPLIKIGTAGGQTKSSSGYTFQFIQKQSDAIVAALLQNKHPNSGTGWLSGRFKMYDDTLLHILYNQTLTAEEVFTNLFRHNKPQQIFKFLDNETSVKEELKIMSTVPAQHFLPAVLSQWLS